MPQTPQGYTAAQYAQTGYPPSQSQYDVHTPSSAQSPAPHNWQYQHPQNQHHQQNHYQYQQNGYYAPGSTLCQESYYPPSEPIGYQYGGQATNVVDQSPSQEARPSLDHPTPPTDHTKSMQDFKSEMDAAAPSRSPSSIPQGSTLGADLAHKDQRSTEESSVSMRSQTMSPQQAVDEDRETEVEENDLNCLDVPDLSLSVKEWGNGSWPCLDLVLIVLKEKKL